MMRQRLCAICLTLALFLLSACVMAEKGEGIAVQHTLADEILAMREAPADVEERSFIDERLSQVAAEMDERLAVKYPGKVFHVQSFSTRSVDRACDVFRLSVEDSDIVVTVEAEETEDGSYAFRDDFYGSLHDEDYEKYIELTFEDVAPGLRAYSTIHCMLGDAYTIDTPLETAVNDADFFAYTWVLLPPDTVDFARVAAAFKQSAETLGLGGDFTLYMLASPLPTEATKADVFGLIPSHNDAKPVYTVRERFFLYGRDGGND